MMRILVHTCCAPCLIVPLEKLRSKGEEVTCYFYNPNIHPYAEFSRRLDVLEGYCVTQNIPLIYENYDPTDYFHGISQNLEKPRRCQLCYRVRIERVAEMAKIWGLSAFTTTLLVSPYQDHDFIRMVSEQVAAKLGTLFYYNDWRSSYRDGVIKSRELGMYRQKYCGCLFSEKERLAEGRQKSSAS